VTAPHPDAPLAGVTVIDAGLLVQGPQAAAMLQLLGADVVKVELPNIGDHARWLPISGEDLRAPFFISCNRGKRSVTVDLRTPSGRSVFLRLAERADVIITNFKAGTMDAWGLGYGDVAAVNPGIVYATGSAFGSRGPDGAREGADLSAQAAGGLIADIGVDGGDPSPVPATICDHMASQNLVSGILAALLARARTGRGQHVEVSLLGSQLWAQAPEYTYTLLTGADPGRANGGHPMIPGVYGIFPTADGWIALVGLIGAARSAFLELIGREDLVLESDRTTMFDAISAVTPSRSTGEWCVALTEREIRHAPVRDRAAVVADPQVVANDYVVMSEGDELVVGSPIRMSAAPSRIEAHVPTLGEHTDEILGELGYDAGQIAQLRADGAV
jgi:crotonobetainyl-CoA:carnitine CoA-transferase CaiB-like acyl-CoA transferase